LCFPFRDARYMTIATHAGGFAPRDPPKTVGVPLGIPCPGPLGPGAGLAQPGGWAHFE